MPEPQDQFTASIASEVVDVLEDHFLFPGGYLLPSLNNLGHLAFEQENYATARTLHEESLALRRELGEKMGINVSHNNLGNVYYGLSGKYSPKTVMQLCRC